MTGKELIKWIQENEAEEMEIVWADDEYDTVYRIEPQIKENAELKDEYRADWLKKEGKSVVL